jgi:hypothetical protein
MDTAPDLSSTDHRNPVSVPLANLRDLGGLAVAGGSVRVGALWRSDDVTVAPPHELAALRDCGVHTVLDLRSPAERDRTPDLGQLTDGFDHHRLALTEFVADPLALAARLADVTTPARLGEWYAALAEESAAILVRGLDLVAASAGSTLVFCSAGKDRTGIFAAAVLSVLGADDDVIVEDYCLTDGRIADVFVRLGQAHGIDATAMARLIDPDSPLLRAPAEAMTTLLELLRERYGGFVSLLGRAGLSLGTVAKLRDRLVA